MVFVLSLYKLCATSTVQTWPVELDQVLRYFVRRFSRDFSCSLSVPTDFVTDVVFLVHVTANMIDELYIDITCSFPCRRAVFCRWIRLIYCRHSPCFGSALVASSVLSWVIDLKSVLKQETRRLWVNWYHVHQIVFDNIYHVQQDGGSSKWASYFQQEFQSRLTCHSLGSSFFGWVGDRLIRSGWMERW